MYGCKYSYIYTPYTMHTDYRNTDCIWGHGGKHCNCYRPQDLLALLTALVSASQRLSSIVCCENVRHGILLQAASGI